VAERSGHPIAAAMQWVARIFAAALMMSLPGLGGQRLDKWWGTSFLGPAGFVLGLIGGMSYLIAATRSAEAKRKSDKRSHDETMAPR